jgi:hypothetical protein
MRMENRAPPSIKWGRLRIYPREALMKWYDAKIQKAIEEAEVEAEMETLDA